MTGPSSEPVIVIAFLAMPAAAADGFVDSWSANSAALRDAPGFRGTRLLRALSTDEEYQLVNIAQWDSTEQWQAALSALPRSAAQRCQADSAGVTPRHAFYRVVAVAPDPAEAVADS